MDLPFCFRCAALAALCAFAATAPAHDTWFDPAGGELALGTGTTYPLRESGIDAKYLVHDGCRSGAELRPLQPLRNIDDALVVAEPPGPASCWAQLTPFEIELAPDKIALYLHEVRPPRPLLDAWSAMQARGLPWKERYTKHARISLGAGSAADAEPSGMDMDVVIESRSPLVFRVLRDGRPLPGFNVELRYERARFGIWRRTDDQGRLEFKPPLPGRWLLRGVDLRLSDHGPDAFDSRFVTLVFEAPAQNGSSLKFNARSASQIAATTTIAAEPSTNTPR